MTNGSPVRPQVILYTKPGCHLCEEARDQMLAGGADQFDLIEINITTDWALYERYRYDIPVVFVNGQETFRHQVTTAAFRDALNRARLEPLSGLQQ